jgi:hypothetical protein
LGYPPIGLVDEGSLRGCNNQGKPYILGLNAEALRPKKGNLPRNLARLENPEEIKSGQRTILTSA